MKIRYIFTFLLLNIFTNLLADTGSVRIIKKNIEYKFKIVDGKPLADVVVEEKYKTGSAPESVRLNIYYNDVYKLSDIRITPKKKKIKPRYTNYGLPGTFYDNNNKLCHIEIPFEKSGEEVSITYKTNISDLHFLVPEMLFSHLDIDTITFKINQPEWLSLNIGPVNFPDNFHKDEYVDNISGDSVVCFTLTSISKYSQELNSPPPAKHLPHVNLVVAGVDIADVHTPYFDTPNSIYLWYSSFLDSRAVDMDVVRQCVDSIIGNDAQQDKSAMIYKWVQANIRYRSISMEHADRLSPDSPQDVISKGYADCKGMANLLKQMFIAAGLDARIVWISTNELRDFNQPFLMPVANHMLCAINDDGKYSFFDPTLRNLPCSFIRADMQGKTAMIENGPTFQFHTMPSLPPEASTDYVLQKSVFDGSEIISFDSRNVISGLFKESASAVFNIKSNASNIKNFLGHDRVRRGVSDINVKPFDIHDQSIEITFKEKMTSGVTRIDNRFFLSFYDSYMLPGKIDTTIYHEDKALHFTNKIVRRVEMMIPSEYIVDYLPDSVEIPLPGFLFKAGYEMSGNILIYNQEVLQTDKYLMADKFDEYNRAFRLVTDFGKQQVIIKIR